MEATLSEIADIVGGKIIGDPKAVICGAASFEDAKVCDITFAGDAGFLKNRRDRSGSGYSSSEFQRIFKEPDTS